MTDDELIEAAERAYRREVGTKALRVDRTCSAVRRDGGTVRVRLADRDDEAIAIYHLRGRALVPRGLP